MTDQQRADSLGAFGNPAAHTPNLDALAARGTRFTNAYSQHSACSQSRVSIFTGWYPHVSGHRTLDNLLKAWEPNLLAILRQAGYHVAWAGIRGDTFAPGVTADSADFFGFLVKPSLEAVASSHREVFGPESRLRYAHYLGRLEDEDPLDFDEAAVQTAIRLIQDGLPEPFVLLLTLFAPHPPFAVTEPWYSMHAREAMPAPVTAHMGKAEFMTVMRERAGLEALTSDDWSEITATYYGMVSRLDDQLGRVMKALDVAGTVERTVTCFFTDHGEYLGDYGLVEKWPSGLDSCLLRNPLVMGGPGIPEAHECGALVEMVDLLPTVCELADAEVGHVHFGRSLISAMRDGAASHRDAAFSESGFRPDEEPQDEPLAGYPYDLKTNLLHELPALVGRAVAMRTENWTYVYRSCEADELYERTVDPGETTNVSAKAEHAAILAELRGRLLDWLVNTTDVVPLVRDPRMEPALLEQIDP